MKPTKQSPRNIRKRTADRPAPSAKGEKFQARVNRYLKVFIKLLDAYERDHPNWRAEALFWLIEYGLVRLRYYVESKRESEISWDSPFVELHYPIDWNWDAWRDGKTTGISINSGVLNERNTRTKKVAARTLASIMVKHLTILALQQFTNNVGTRSEAHVLSRFWPRTLESFSRRSKANVRRRESSRGFFIRSPWVPLVSTSMSQS